MKEEFAAADGFLWLVHIVGLVRADDPGHRAGHVIGADRAGGADHQQRPCCWPICGRRSKPVSAEAADVQIHRLEDGHHCVVASFIHYLSGCYDWQGGGGVVAAIEKLLAMMWPTFHRHPDRVAGHHLHHYCVIRELGRLIGEERLLRMFFRQPAGEAGRLERGGPRNGCERPDDALTAAAPRLPVPLFLLVGTPGAGAARSGAVRRRPRYRLWCCATRDRGGEAAGRVVPPATPPRTEEGHQRRRPAAGIRAIFLAACWCPPRGSRPKVRDGCALGRHFARGDERGADRPGAVAMKLRRRCGPGVRVASVAGKAVVIEKRHARRCSDSNAATRTRG